MKYLDKVYINDPNRPNWAMATKISVADAMKTGWFVSAVFGSTAWVIKKRYKFFKSRLVNIRFDCDQELAEREINAISSKMYKKYYNYMKGKQ